MTLGPEFRGQIGILQRIAGRKFPNNYHRQQNRYCPQFFGGMNIDYSHSFGRASNIFNVTATALG